MDAAAAPRDRGVAAVREATRVPVVADGEDVLEQLVGHHGPDPEPQARRPLGELLGHPHIHLVQWNAVNGWYRGAVGEHVQAMSVGGDAVLKDAHAAPGPDRNPRNARGRAVARATRRSRTGRVRSSAPGARRRGSRDGWRTRSWGGRCARVPSST